MIPRIQRKGRSGCKRLSNAGGPNPSGWSAGALDLDGLEPGGIPRAARIGPGGPGGNGEGRDRLILGSHRVA